MICIIIVDIDAPIQVGGGGAAGPEANPEQIDMITDMGFNASQARKALRETVSTILIYKCEKERNIQSDILGKQRRTCYRVAVQSS